MNPLVSVAMGVYNVERFVKPAVESVLTQNYDRIEMVVVDDGSTDDTVARLEEIQDPRLRIIRCAHRGSAPTRNHAIRQSTGKYVAPMDGDDLYLPGKLVRHVEALENNPDLDVSFSLFRTIDEDGNDLGIEPHAPPEPLSMEVLLAANPINGSAAVVRCTALDASGLFDETLPSCLDMDLWMRLALVREGNLHCVPEALSAYRRRRGQITGDWRRMERGWLMMMDKLRTMAPARLSRVYGPAGCHWYRFLSHLADAQGERKAALRCLAKSVRFSPAHGLGNLRTWLLGAAIVSRYFLPEGVHSAMRRTARRVVG
jgi:glycosyltransferase involved in cell wall biosynthesis